MSDVRHIFNDGYNSLIRLVRQGVRARLGSIAAAEAPDDAVPLDQLQAIIAALGPGGSGSTWYSGSGDPISLSIPGILNDYYLDLTTGDVWTYNAAPDWTATGLTITGPAGPAGATGATGSIGFPGAISLEYSYQGLIASPGGAVSSTQFKFEETSPGLCDITANPMIWISKDSFNGGVYQTLLLAAPGTGIITLYKNATSWVRYNVIAISDTPIDSYMGFVTSFIDQYGSSTPFPPAFSTNDTVYFQITIKGATGPTGAAGLDAPYISGYIDQNSTNAPTMTIVNNTTPDDYTATGFYDSAGDYHFDHVTSIPDDSRFQIFPNWDFSRQVSEGIFTQCTVNSGKSWIKTADAFGSGTVQDLDILTRTPFKIEFPL